MINGKILAGRTDVDNSKSNNNYCYGNNNESRAQRVHRPRLVVYGIRPKRERQYMI